MKKVTLFILAPIIATFVGFGNGANAEEEPSPLTNEEFNESDLSEVYNDYDLYLEEYEQHEEKKEEFFSEAPEVSVQNYTPRAGDILTTDDTSKDGFTGHNGIVTISGNIVHAPGYGEPVESYTWAEWQDRYNNTRVDRPSNLSHGQSAANQGSIIYEANPRYHLNTNLVVTDPTYCSKLVYQSYSRSTGGAISPDTNFVMPYELVDLIDTPLTTVYNDGV